MNFRAWLSGLSMNTKMVLYAISVPLVIGIFGALLLGAISLGCLIVAAGSQIGGLFAGVLLTWALISGSIYLGIRFL